MYLQQVIFITHLIYHEVCEKLLAFIYFVTIICSTILCIQEVIYMYTKSIRFHYLLFCEALIRA